MAEETNQPLISVVMCAYNGMPYIRQAVSCILQQTYPALELIISDDGSDDGTREWLRELEDHPKVRLFFQEKNLGYVANKNFAHQQAKGEYITQQDNDDTCTPDRLERQMAALQLHPDIKIAACGYSRIDDAGNLLNNTGPGQDTVIRSKGPDPYPFWFPSLLVHRTVFEDVGLFHTYFAGLLGDDMYWTVRANEKYPILCLAKPMYGYRNNPGSITNVLTSTRKLLMPEVLDKLFRQRLETGTDWLEQGRPEAVRKYEDSLLQDKKFMAEHFRIWAAKAIDKKNFLQAKALMKKTFMLHPLNKALYRTLLYYLRQKAP